MRPKSSSSTFICRKSIAFTVPSEISISYDSPVRLSVTDSVSWAVATPPPFSLSLCSSAIASPLLQPVVRKGYGSAAPAAEQPGKARRHARGARGLERQLGDLGRRDRERYCALGGARHLGRVHEAALTRVRLDDDPVEDPLAVQVADLVDRADLHLVRAEHRRPSRELAVVDGYAVVDHVRCVAFRSVRPRSRRTRAGGRGSGSPCGPRRGGPGLRGRGWSGPMRGLFQSSLPSSVGAGGRVAHQTR